MNGSAAVVVTSASPGLPLTAASFFIGLGVPAACAAIWAVVAHVIYPFPAAVLFRWAWLFLSAGCALAYVAIEPWPYPAGAAAGAVMAAIVILLSRRRRRDRARKQHGAKSRARLAALTRAMRGAARPLPLPDPAFVQHVTAHLESTA